MVKFQKAVQRHLPVPLPVQPEVRHVHSVAQDPSVMKVGHLEYLIVVKNANIFPLSVYQVRPDLNLTTTEYGTWGLWAPWSVTGTKGSMMTRSRTCTSIECSGGGIETIPCSGPICQREFY